MKKSNISYKQYLLGKTNFVAWFSTPIWLAFVLPWINILYFTFGGLTGLIFALYHLTPVGLFSTFWDGVLVLFKGEGTFIQGLTGSVKFSNQLFATISYELIIFIITFYSYKKNNKS